MTTPNPIQTKDVEEQEAQYRFHVKSFVLERLGDSPIERLMGNVIEELDNRVGSMWLDLYYMDYDKVLAEIDNILWEIENRKYDPNLPLGYTIEWSHPEVKIRVFDIKDAMDWIDNPVIRDVEITALMARYRLKSVEPWRSVRYVMHKITIPRDLIEKHIDQDPRGFMALMVFMIQIGLNFKMPESEKVSWEIQI